MNFSKFWLSFKKKIELLKNKFREFCGGGLCFVLVTLSFLIHFISITCCKLLLFKSFQPLGEKKPSTFKKEYMLFLLVQTVLLFFFSEPF